MREVSWQHARTTQKENKMILRIILDFTHFTQDLLVYAWRQLLRMCTSFTHVKAFYAEYSNSRIYAQYLEFTQNYTVFT